MPLFVNDVLRKAERHAKRGETELALEMYNSVLQEYPNNKRANEGLKRIQQSHSASGAKRPAPPQDRIDELIALYNQRRFPEALVCGEKLSRQYPDTAVIPAIIGASNAGLGRWDEAVENYRNALRIKPDYAEVHNNLGAALNELGKHGEATACLAQALQITPGFAVAHNNLGIALKKLGKLDEAEASFHEAVRLKPDYAEAHNNLGNTLNERGRSDEAAACLTRALQHKPDFAAAHNNLGNVLSDLGKPADAVNCFHSALQLRPDFAEAHNNLGNALNDLGHQDEALASFASALDIAPDFAGAHRNMSALKTYPRDDPHIRQMQRLVERRGISDDDRMHLHFALGKAFGDIGDHDTAYSHLARGNHLLKEQRQYALSADEAAFAKIRSWFAGDAPAQPDIRLTRDERNRRPIFVLGMPRSGTTLVEQILASHSQVYGAGELHLLERSVREIEWNSARLSADQLQSVQASYFAGLAKLGTSKRYVTDKMPLNFRWIGFICTTMPEAKIVHLKRDARATCWSIFKHYFSHQGHGFANDLQDLAEYYKLYTGMMVFWHERFPGRIYDLTYETLTERQEEQTQRLLEFVGLDWEDQCLAFYKTERAVQTSSVTQVRQKMYQGSSEEWQRYENHLKPLVESLALY